MADYLPPPAVPLETPCLSALPLFFARRTTLAGWRGGWGSKGGYRLTTRVRSSFGDDNQIQAIDTWREDSIFSQFFGTRPPTSNSDRCWHQRCQNAIPATKGSPR